MSPQEIFLTNLDLIERLASRIARRHHASVEEAEEFSSELKVKLIEDDYAVLRKFKGTSSLKTYLTTVVTHAFLDFRNQRWGKWRPSAAAKALGPLAVRLQKILETEDRSFDEACEILLTNYRVTATRRELEEIWKRLPSRPLRSIEGEGPLTDLPAPGVRPEDEVFEHELRETRARVNTALQKVLRGLPMEDRLIVRLGVVDSVKIVDIARTMCLEQKPFYRRLKRILRGLRSDLEQEGVRWAQVSDLLNRSDLGWGFSGRKAQKPEEN